MQSLFTVGYIDGIIVGKFPKTVFEMLQTALNTVSKLYDKVGLTVNLAKTIIVFFT